MLSKHAINGAYPLAALLQRNHKVLEVQPGTALSDVLEACSGLDIGTDVEGADVDLSSADRVADAVMAASEAGQEDHDDAIMSIRDHGYKAVAFTMDLARNKVNPQIGVVVDAVQKHLVDARAAQITPLCITPQFLSPALTSPSLTDLIAPYKDATVINVEPVVLGAVWEDGAEDYHHLKTGISDFDQQVSDYLNKSEVAVRDVWERFFGNVPGKYRDSDFQSAASTMDNSLVAFLGAHRLLESPEVPENLEVSLSTYRTYLAQVREQAGARIAFLLKGMVDARKAQQLVITSPRINRPNEIAKGSIVVVGETYNQWLHDGGSPEVLYGAVQSQSPLNYKTLLDDAEEHQAAWNRLQHLVQARYQSNFQSNLIQGLFLALMDMGAAIEDDQMVVGRQVLPTTISNALDQISFKADSIDHLYSIARDLVCDVFYPQTDVKQFLCALDTTCEEHPGIDLREAALLVSIKYVTDWVGQQMIVNNA